MIRKLELATIALCCFSAAAPAADNAAPDAGKRWVADMPRQNWATSDKLLELKPLQRIDPASIADRMMIADVFARWGIAYDEGWLDVVRSLFTEDGVLDGLSGSAKPGSGPMMHYVGRDAIAKAVERDRARQGDQRRHAMTNVVIDQLGKDTATAFAYGVVTAAGNDELYLGASVLYRAELKKQADGVWRLQRFVIGIDSYKRLMPTAAAAQPR